MAVVTFVIPTMGRDTLSRALMSLYDQSDMGWKAVVVYDNRFENTLESTEYAEQVRIVTASEGGHAGLVRNYGIDLVDTKWTAFLDDDDWVEPSYVQKLNGYSISHPQLDLIVFTYKDVTNGNTIPNKKQTKIEACQVGISFAVKTDFINEHKIRFTPFAIEDFRFLNECVQAGAKYWLSHDLLYNVGGIGGWVRKD
jgi:glycosyltransferase involved in cell wall biosynthesis